MSETPDLTMRNPASERAIVAFAEHVCERLEAYERETHFGVRGAVRVEAVCRIVRELAAAQVPKRVSGAELVAMLDRRPIMTAEEGERVLAWLREERGE
jgi:hypothetical protein